MPCLDASALEIDRPGLRLLAEVLSDRSARRNPAVRQAAAAAPHRDPRSIGSHPAAGSPSRRRRPFDGSLDRCSVPPLP